MIDADNLFIIVAKMGGGMPFFPGDVDGRIGIAEAMADMCETEDQARWLAKRMGILFSRWPGVKEMRAVYCSKYRPLDREEANSDAFPEGVPSEVPGRDDEMAGYLPATSKRLQLAAGEVSVISASPSIQSTLEALREAKALRTGKQALRVPGIPVVQITAENRITAADIERAKMERAK